MSFWDGGPRLDGVRVLVVEDLLHVRDMVSEALELWGASVIAVESAVKGLETLKRERPDVLISSLAMPDRDGYWLIRQVRSLSDAKGGNTPAAAFTGCTTREDRLKALRAGFQYHVAKPADLAQLAEVVALLSIQAKGPVLVH
jgi:two-component system, chemotaxis family, CheB/CheR fusion protein